MIAEIEKKVFRQKKSWLIPNRHKLLRSPRYWMKISLAMLYTLLFENLQHLWFHLQIYQLHIHKKDKRHWFNDFAHCFVIFVSISVISVFISTNWLLDSPWSLFHSIWWFRIIPKIQHIFHLLTFNLLYNSSFTIIFSDYVCSWQLCHIFFYQ